MAHSRIDDLRRRVEADPASIAFAQLAEEYRRAGQIEEAVRVSRDGLTRHPGYLSARVTLGRALLELGQLDDARIELQFVVSEAPENLAAIRGLAEICHREGDVAAALDYFQRALALARHDPELEEIVQQLSRQAGAAAGPGNGLSFEEAHQELLSAPDRLPLAGPPIAEPPGGDSDDAPTAPFNFDTLVAALGTPAAPPLVDAVANGERPPVFELPPDPPAVNGDPFAALEAELRAHADPADDGVETLTELAPSAPAGEKAPEAGDDEPPATRPWQPAEAPSIDVAPVFDAPFAAAAAADEEGEPLVATPPAGNGRIEPHHATADAADAAPTLEGAAEALPDAAAFHQALAEMVDDAVREVPAEAAAAPAEPPLNGPARAAHADDVLGDLEDWLHTLQDRSGQ